MTEEERMIMEPVPGLPEVYAAGEDSVLRLALKGITRNALVRNGVVRISALIELRDSGRLGELGRLRNIGRGGLADIERALDEPLRPCPPAPYWWREE